MKKLLLLLFSLILSFNSYALSIVNLPRVVYIDVPVYICDDDLAPRDITNSDKSDESGVIESDESGVIESDESRAIEYVLKAVFIRLTPDDPRCEKPIYNHLDEELTVNPTIVYVEREIVALLCGDLIISVDTPDITSNEEEVIDTLSYIKLEPDDPRCIEAKKNND
ncbi:hypothetical protein N9I58_00550 [Candidatus Thioglobus sp.]|nr:hypothetical protein [Candidatus Thioglobus sp.]